MENCSICNSDYKKAYKSDHLKSIKHLQKLINIIVKNVTHLCHCLTSLII